VWIAVLLMAQLSTVQVVAAEPSATLPIDQKEQQASSDEGRVQSRGVPNFPAPYGSVTPLSPKARVLPDQRYKPPAPFGSVEPLSPKALLPQQQYPRPPASLP
jgi:hypothetical protein